MRQLPVLQNPAVALAVLALVTLALYHQTVLGLVRLWTQPDNAIYHHGLVLVVICAFLFYTRWVGVQSSIHVRPSLSAPLLILLTSCAWLLASLVSVLMLQALSLTLLLGLIVASVVGYRSALLFALPVSLIIFALPVWEPLSPHLQLLTAHAVTFLLNLTGISAALEDTWIWTSAGSFHVDTGCSGISLLIVGTMAGVLFAHLNRLGRRAAIWVVAGAAAVSVLANTLRIYIVVVAGQLTEMQHYLVTTDHLTLGWVLFGVGMFIFLLAASRVIARGGSERNDLRIAPSRTVVGSNRPGVVRNALLALVALAVGPALLYAYQSDRGEVGRVGLNLPTQIEGWRVAGAPGMEYRPVYHNPDFDYETLYRRSDGPPVYLFVAHYVLQEQGKKAVYYRNRVYDDKLWNPVLSKTQQLGDTASVQETRIKSRAGGDKLVWQWYYVHGFMVSNDYIARLVNGWGMLRGDQAITVLVVAAAVNGSYENARALLLRFVTDTRPALERAIDEMGMP